MQVGVACSGIAQAVADTLYRTDEPEPSDHVTSDRASGRRQP